MKISDDLRQKYPLLSGAVSAMLNTDEGAAARRSADVTSIRAELAALIANPEEFRDYTDGVFGVDVTPEELFRTSMSAHLQLGANEEVHRFIGCIWAAKMRSWSTHARTEFLQVTVRDKHQVFTALNFASEMVAHAEISAGEALPWLTAAYRLISKDLVQHGFWNIVRALCTNSPSEAMATINEWLDQYPDDGALEIIANMIGWLRFSLPPKTIAEHFRSIEERLRGGDPGWRAAYIRSWARNPEHLDEATGVALCKQYVRPGGPEETSWIYVLSVLTQSSADSWPWTLRELRRVANTNITAQAKYWVAQAALHGHERASQKESWRDLLVAILPLGSEQDGIWRDIEYHLVELAQKDAEAMRVLLKRLSCYSGDTLIRLIRDRKLTYLLSVVSQQNLHTGIVGDLCFAADANSRRVGLLVFAECQAPLIAADIVTGATARQLELLLLEAQRFAIDHAALARLHACLAFRVDELDRDLQFLLYDEVAIQSLNSHAYRSELRKTAPQHQYLHALLDDVDQRLADTENAAESMALRMEIPHRNAAEILSGKRMAREVAKGVREHSILLNLISNVTLIYGGTRWRTFRPDGSLSQASGLHESSATVEVPRLELFDPEGMQLRRLRASARIGKIEREPAGEVRGEAGSR